MEIPTSSVLPYRILGFFNISGLALANVYSQAVSSLSLACESLLGRRSAAPLLTAYTESEGDTGQLHSILCPSTLLSSH